MSKVSCTCVHYNSTELNIQLRFNGILSCREYTLLNPIQKLEDISAGLARGIDSEPFCDCGFNTSFISNAFLKCFNENSPQHVTYRAVLSETESATTIQLVTYIEQWIGAVQSLVVQGVSIGINNTCPVVIVDLNSLECPEVTTPPSRTETTDSFSGVNKALIGGMIAGLLVLLAVVAAVIVITVVVVRHHRTRFGINNIFFLRI